MVDHWFNVPERIKYKLADMVCRCLEDTGQSSDVLERPLHSIHHRQQATPTISYSHAASTDCTARPSGFLCCWPHGLEVTTDSVSFSRP